MGSTTRKQWQTARLIFIFIRSNQRNHRKTTALTFLAVFCKPEGFSLRTRKSHENAPSVKTIFQTHLFLMQPFTPTVWFHRTNLQIFFFGSSYILFPSFSHVNKQTWPIGSLHVVTSVVRAKTCTSTEYPMIFKQWPQTLAETIPPNSANRSTNRSNQGIILAAACSSESDESPFLPSLVRKKKGPSLHVRFFFFKPQCAFWRMNSLYIHVFKFRYTRCVKAFGL